MRAYIGPMAVSSSDLKAFLLDTPFFGGLPDASLDLLISMLVERRFDAGATVVAEGEAGRSMFIVHAGELVVSKLLDCGRVIRMSRLAPGDFFGELAALDWGAGFGYLRTATVMATTPARLLVLTPATLSELFRRAPDLERTVKAAATERMRRI